MEKKTNKQKKQDAKKKQVVTGTMVHQIRSVLAFMPGDTLELDGITNCKSNRETVKYNNKAVQDTRLQTKCTS